MGALGGGVKVLAVLRFVEGLFCTLTVPLGPSLYMTVHYITVGLSSGVAVKRGSTVHIYMYMCFHLYNSSDKFHKSYMYVENVTSTIVFLSAFYRMILERAPTLTLALRYLVPTSRLVYSASERCPQALSL